MFFLAGNSVILNVRAPSSGFVFYNLALCNHYGSLSKCTLCQNKSIFFFFLFCRISPRSGSSPAPICPPVGPSSSSRRTAPQAPEQNPLGASPPEPAGPARTPAAAAAQHAAAGEAQAANPPGEGQCTSSSGERDEREAGGKGGLQEDRSVKLLPSSTPVALDLKRDLNSGCLQN